MDENHLDVLDDRDLAVDEEWSKTYEGIVVSLLSFTHRDGTVERSIFANRRENLSAQIAEHPVLSNSRRENLSARGARTLAVLLLDAALEVDRLNGEVTE